MVTSPARMLIYVVTDRRLRPDLTPEALVDEVARSGADMIQIREKDLPARSLLELAWCAAASPADVFVNGRPDIALTAGAEGVHLPAAGLPPERVKEAWGMRLRVGVSTHGLGEAVAAERSGADFITFGPVYETPSKGQYGPPLGIASLNETVETVGIPVFAIGGIDAARAGEVAGTGAAGVAVISSVVGSRNMKEAVARLRGESV